MNHGNPKRGDIKNKILIEAHLTMGIILILSIVSVYYFVFEYEMKEQLQSRLIGIAQTGALLIDAEDHNRIRTRNDEKSVGYKNIQSELRKLKKANPGVRFIYTMRKTDNKNVCEFVVDAEDSKSRDFSHVGDSYDVSGSELKQLRKSYEQPIADESFVTDKWGTFLSGYAPIKDKTGATVGIVGVDLSACTVIQHQKDMIFIAIVIFIVAFIITSLTSHRRANAVINPINQIKEATKQVMNGNLDFRLSMNTNDQFEEIACALNETADTLINYQRSLENNLKILEQQQDHLMRRLKIEQIISLLSKRFLETPDFNKRIDYALAKIGQASGANRSYFFLINKNGTFSNNGEWCAKGVTPILYKIQNLRSDMFPWSMKKFCDGQNIYVENVSDIPPEASAEKELFDRLGIKSVVAFPVFTGKLLAGFIGFTNVVLSPKWSEDYTTLLSIASEIIGNAWLLRVAQEKIMSNNLIMTKELEMAAEVQQELLPIKDIEIPGIKFAWEFKPSIYIGGDMFSFFKIDESRIGIYILDVKGHGVSAALKAVTLSYLLEPSCNPGSCINGKISGSKVFKPSQTIRFLNERFCSESGKNFFTMFYGILDIRNFTLTYSIAGHYPPIIVPQGGKSGLLNYGGPAVGLLKDICYSDYEVQLKSGDKLILYTDGVTEAQNQNESSFGLQKFINIIDSNRARPISDIIDLTIEEVLQYSNEASNNDDITVLGFEIT